MGAKRWIKLFLYSFFGFYLFFITLEVLIDPYQVVGSSLTEKKFRYSSELETTKLFNMLKGEQQYSLVLGTSRSQQLHYDGSDIPILNFASLYGNSISVLEFFKQLDSKQIKNIHKVYYLVDDHCLNGYDQKDIFSRYTKQVYDEDKLLYKIKHLLSLDFKKITDTIVDIAYNFFGYSYYMNDQGAMIRSDKYETCLVPEKFTAKPTKQFYTKEGIEALVAIDHFCKDNNIDISYFTPTHFHLNNKLQDPKIIKDKWSLLLDGGLDGFYALWYIDGISNKIENNRYVCFKDTNSHLNSFYNHKVFIENVVKGDQKYYISTPSELQKYLLENKKHFQ